MKYLRNLSLLVIALGLLLSGCAGTPKKAGLIPIQELNAPEWVLKGSGAFEGDRGRVFYGVGVADYSSSETIQREAAKTRARNELAKVLELYNASLTKDYIAQTRAGKLEGVAEGHFEQAIKQVTSMTLRGVQIVDFWQNPATGALYALARLDLEAYTDTFDKLKQLDARIRDYVRNNAKRLHEELEEELEKREKRE